MAKKKAVRRKKVAAGSVGLTPAQVSTADGADLDRLASQVDADGGSVLARYSEPFGGKPVLLAALRVGARWAVDRYWKGTPLPPRRGFAGLRQDSVALALALNFLLIYRATAPAAGDAALAVVVIGVVLAQLATAYPLLTASPAPAEVS